jgi:hypothetical protein
MTERSRIPRFTFGVALMFCAAMGTTIVQGWDGTHNPESGTGGVTYGLPDVDLEVDIQPQNREGLRSCDIVVRNGGAALVPLVLAPLSPKYGKIENFFEDCFVSEQQAYYSMFKPEVRYYTAPSMSTLFSVWGSTVYVHPKYELATMTWTDATYQVFRYFHFGPTLAKDDKTLAALGGVDNTITKAIVLVHGWNSDGTENAYKSGEWKKLRDGLIEKTKNTGWRVLSYRWEQDAATNPKGATGLVWDDDGSFGPQMNGSQSAEIAYQHGRHLGELIQWQIPNLQKVHFIAHSAGTWTARTAAKHIHKQGLAVQITLLDPFIAGQADANSKLSKTIIDNIPDDVGTSLYRAENYYWVDITDLYGGCTSQVFQWGEDMHVQKDLGTYQPVFFTSDLLNVPRNVAKWIKAHGYPIRDYASSVKSSVVIMDDEEPLGWAKSMFIDEMTPGIATPVSPSGAQYANKLTYEWYAAARADVYELACERRLPAASNWEQWKVQKGISVFTVSVSGHKSGFLYRWRVRASNKHALGEWSDYASFNVDAVTTLPSKPVGISPTGTISDRTPVFRWNADPRATTYDLVVKQGTKQILNKTRIAGTSYASTKKLSDGAYTWYLRGQNSVGYGPWSDNLAFSVGSVGYVYNIALVWGENPRDLDAHLVTPSGIEVYYGNRGSRTEAPYAGLDLDDTSGYGPENVSLYQVQPGTYKYFVRLFAGSGSLTSSAARVAVVDASGNILLDRRVPTMGTGNYWHVFDIVNNTILPKDVITTTKP